MSAYHELRHRTLLVLSLLVGLAACGQDPAPTQPEEEEPDTPLFTEVACPGFALEAAAGVPLDEIAIGVLPGSFELPVAASITVGDSAHIGLAFVRTGDPEAEDEADEEGDDVHV